jgi:hypothetical protein
MHIGYQISENDFVVAANLAMRKRSWLTLFTLYLLPCIGAILVATATVTLIAGTRLSSVLSLVHSVFFGFACQLFSIRFSFAVPIERHLYSGNEEVLI